MALVDFFLKIDTIPGESPDDKHKDEIQLLSWGWSELNSGSHALGGGGGAGKVQMNDFEFTMYTNKASPKLLLACANGAHIDSALLTCRKAGTTQQEYLKIKFSGLLISKYQTGGGGGPDLVMPIDKISINFTKIEYEYYPQDAKGNLGSKIPAGWDLKLNKAV